MDSSSKEESSDSDYTDADADTDANTPSTSTSTRPELTLFTGNLDRGKVSVRTAFRTAASFAVSVGVPVRGISKSTLYRRRKTCRDETAKQMKVNFNPEVPLTAHWDGIKVAALTEKKGVERLPVHVTGEGVEQLLGASPIANGTGLAQAGEVMNKLEEWGCLERVSVACTDTTSSITGWKKGAVAHLEKLLKKVLLYLACRHHVLEVIPKHLFNQMVEKSSNPELGVLCSRFADVWKSLDKTDFTPVTKDLNALRRVLSESEVKDILEFIYEALKVCLI